MQEWPQTQDNVCDNDAVDTTIGFMVGVALDKSTNQNTSYWYKAIVISELGLVNTNTYVHVQVYM